jgi:hypothetical protein
MRSAGPPVWRRTGIESVNVKVSAADIEVLMEIDEQKVDEISLALLYLTTFKDKSGFRAWKSHSWDVLDRLHESGYIDDPRTKAKSVLFTDEGEKRSKVLFEKHFAK